MKKLFLSLLIIMSGIVAAHAQKFALIDMEFILKQIPSYEQANKQMEIRSSRRSNEEKTGANFSNTGCNLQCCKRNSYTERI